jgi:thiosulfate dehydrogenase [quinone] large subunit
MRRSGQTPRRRRSFPAHIKIVPSAQVGLRLAAPTGDAMTALKWIAEWPPVQRLSDGSPSMSVDPFADYHLIYAVLERRQVLGQAAARPHPNGWLR